MIVPTLNPYAVSLIATTQPNAFAAAVPAQAVTRRPTLPPGKGEMPRARDKRDRDQPEKGEGERGHTTDLTV
ncbi:MAG TPA: hypothetical protein VMB81_00465 [Candidatus Sulfotelmatobacter sp.]|nr:hypothetical protein [Candidatus Sulfotelmatobacter sp.]